MIGRSLYEKVMDFLQHGVINWRSVNMKPKFRIHKVFDFPPFYLLIP